MDIIRNIVKLIICFLAASGTKLIVKTVLMYVLPQTLYAKIALWVASFVITGAAVKKVNTAAETQVDELFDAAIAVQEKVASLR